MDDANANPSISQGTEVYGSDGQKVGSIVEVRRDYVVVEKGFFFQTDYYIPASAFAGVHDNRLTLNVTKDAALNQGWDARPDDFDAASGGGHVPDDSVNDVLVDAVAAAPIGGDAAASVGDPVAPMAGETHARVARHEVGQPAGPAETVLEEELIEFPVYGEDVQTQTRVRVAEEVEITKEAVQRTAQATGTVRHEDVRVVGHVVEVDEGGAAPVTEGKPGSDH